MSDKHIIASLRATNKHLNRRCQAAESAADEKVKATSGGMGRALANYAASRGARKVARLRAELHDVAEALTWMLDGAADTCIVCGAETSEEGDDCFLPCATDPHVVDVCCRCLGCEK